MNRNNVEFRELVEYIVCLEDEVQVALGQRRRGEWLEDRLQSLQLCYEQLRCIWPIIKGCGTDHEPSSGGDAC